MNGGSEKEIEISFNLNHVLLKNGLPTRSEIIKKLKKIGAKKMGKIYISRNEIYSTKWKRRYFKNSR